jgi:hypothetical protein
MTYSNLGRERQADVCTLCETCHGKAHRAALRGGTLFVKEVLLSRAGRGRPS